LNKFTVQADFTVHSVGLSVNSAGLSAKSAGWRFHCSNFESNEFQPIFTEFYQIRSIFSKTESEETNSLVSTGFLNTGLDTVSHRSIRSPRLSLSAVLPPPPTRRALIPGPSHRRRLSDAQSWRASRHAPAAFASHTRSSPSSSLSRDASTCSAIAAGSSASRATARWSAHPRRRGPHHRPIRDPGRRHCDGRRAWRGGRRP
jgi:hypothetical protein